MTAKADLFLRVLCVCVRALTPDQAMRLLGFGDPSNLGRFVRPLVERDLVRTVRAFAKPVPGMDGPLLAVGPSGPDGPTAADFRRALYLAGRRWAGVTAHAVVCFVATRRAGRMFGVPRTGQLLKGLQASHDLAVAECLLATLGRGGHVEHWHGEEFALLRLGDKAPDAVLVDADHNTQTVIEVIGSDYREPKLQAIHHECTQRGLAYELW